MKCTRCSKVATRQTVKGQDNENKGGTQHYPPPLPVNYFYLGDDSPRCKIGTTIYKLNKFYSWVSQDTKTLE